VERDARGTIGENVKLVREDEDRELRERRELANPERGAAGEEAEGEVIEGAAAGGGDEGLLTEDVYVADPMIRAATAMADDEDEVDEREGRRELGWG
jgi:hypothetical protein